MFEYLQNIFGAYRAWKERRARETAVEQLKASGEYYSTPLHELEEKMGITGISQTPSRHVFSDYYTIETPEQFRKTKSKLDKQISKWISKELKPASDAT